MVGRASRLRKSNIQKDGYPLHSLDCRILWLGFEYSGRHGGMVSEADTISRILEDIRWLIRDST
jgi:hypothetical protein